MTARVIATITLIVLPLVACTDSPTSAPTPTPYPTPMTADRMASSIEAMRAADAAVIDAHAAVNDAFIDAAAANNSFADELAALDAYAAALHKALEAYRIGLETVLDSYAAAMAELIGIAANDQFDFVVTGTPALAAMNIARAVASETHNTVREVGYKEIQDAVYSATGERERLAALDAFAEDSAALLAANEGYSTAAEAFLVARDDLRNAFFDVVRERKPPRHGDEYAMAVLAATDPVDAGDVMEAAREAARQALPLLRRRRSTPLST